MRRTLTILHSPEIKVVLSPIGPHNTENARGPFDVYAIMVMPEGEQGPAAKLNKRPLNKDSAAEYLAAIFADLEARQ